MKTAVFLGAGASRAFGYPLTNQLLPRILARIKEGRLFSGCNSKAKNQQDRIWFSRTLYRFLPGLADVTRSRSRDLIGIGITDLLTLVDRAVTHGESRAKMSPEAVARFRQLMERAIYESIMQDNDRRTKIAQLALDAFSDWLSGLGKPATVLTTNYDTAVDSRIFKRVGRTNIMKREGRIAQSVDFGFGWRMIESGDLAGRPADAEWSLLKLHGSVNWLKCSLCGQIYVNVHGAVGSKAFTERLDEWNTCHCNDWSRLRLHLVTPSLIRTYQDPQLLGIWQAALEALRTADEWIIIGYSLPAEDVALRSLFLRAWDGHILKQKPRVVIVQKEDPKVGKPEISPTEKIYRTFFPRKNLEYYKSGLENFLQEKRGDQKPPGKTARPQRSRPHRLNAEEDLAADLGHRSSSAVVQTKKPSHRK